MHGSRTLTAESHEQWLDALHPGMDACDERGERIGVVVQAYRHSRAVTEAWFVAEWQACALPGEIVEVEAEPLAAGLRLYIPSGAIAKATESALFLDESRGSLEGDGYHGWSSKPVCAQSLCPLFASDP